MTFQNLIHVRAVVKILFGVDLGLPVTPIEWREVVTAFQKRHLVAHKLGVTDQAYVDYTP